LALSPAGGRRINAGSFCETKKWGGTALGIQFRLRAVHLIIGAAGVATLAGCGPSVSTADKIKRGEYMVSAGACGDCHTPGALLGKPERDKVFGGGSVGFQIPGLGTFFPPNLTPDKDTGLGNWSEDDIAKTIRTGVRPDGRQLAPVMPCEWYGKLTDEDAHAMAAFLKSLAPISNKVPGPFGANETPTGPYEAVLFPPGVQPPAPAAPPAAPATPPQ
jgi:mono/diheme cytochrome c family protein